MRLLRNRIVCMLLLLCIGFTGTLAFVPTATYACEKNAASSNETYSFNPHICPSMLYEAYGEQYSSFFNLCDALREGKDTFECASLSAYVGCMIGGVIEEFFPAAANCIEYIGPDGYSDGVGKIVYTIPKEDFIKREQAFEQKVEKVLRENVRKSDSDFEKCAALYKYMADNYSYNLEEYEGLKSGVLDPSDYGVYRTFMDGKGICGSFSTLYNYLLLQCGVDAYYFNDSGMNHAWSYVKVDGVGYHVDTTWKFTLNDFMTPSSVRMQNLVSNNINCDSFFPLFYFDDGPLDKPQFDFSANDDRYAELRKGWNIISIDRERKVITYDSEDGVKEFAYGDL